MNNITSITEQGAQDKHWREFGFFAANIQHILGESSAQQQWQYFQRYMAYMQEPAQDYEQALNILGTNSQLGEALVKPAFIALFHYGNYRLLPLALAKVGHKICIPVSASVLQINLDYYQSRGVGSGCIELLAAEDPQLFFKLRRMVSQGYHVLCYIDGGTGSIASNNLDLQSLSTMHFGSGTIRARVGFAEMALLLCLPMYSFVHQKKDLLNEPESQSPLIRHDIANGQSRSIIAQNLVQEIYHSFYEHVAQVPWQWECWSYLHHTLFPRSALCNWDASMRYSSFRAGAKCYLLDRFSYQCHEISATQHELLMSNLGIEKNSY